MIDTEEAVRLYIQARDRIADLKERHKQEMQPYLDVLAEAEHLLMTILNATNQQSMRTAAGTAYKSEWSRPVVQDWQKVIDYAVEHERYDLFERRVVKSVVDDIGELPGVVVERGVRVNVRKA